jgi:Cu-Zn family superoxide dismutase
MSKDMRNFSDILVWEKPFAYALISGNKDHEDLHGTVLFYDVPGGVLIRAEVFGLPVGENLWGSRILAFHIHEGENCTGNSQDPFANTGAHYNPTNSLHPEHAGDLPPLFGNKGYAWSAFVTNRFDTKDILGKTIIVHDHPDDFTSQPSGNAGEKIACGKINKCSVDYSDGFLYL